MSRTAPSDRARPTSRTPLLAQDTALLLARVVLGVVLIAHGWQKVQNGGITGTADGFAGMGIPFPEVAAGFAIGVELVGGVLLLAGVLTPLVGLLVVADMGGAWWFAHRDGGIFVNEGGGELVALIAALGLVLLAFGAGRISLDRWVLGGRRGLRSERRGDQSTDAGSTPRTMAETSTRR